MLPAKKKLEMCLPSSEISDIQKKLRFHLRYLVLSALPFPTPQIFLLFTTFRELALKLPRFLASLSILSSKQSTESH